MGKINGIVLAAGYGTRLQPLTDHIPKPMLPICNRPLLENIVMKMFAAGIAKLAVNTHHLPEKVRKFVSQSPFSKRTTIFHEPEILGIGGAIVNCRPVLEKGDFFVLHNGDVLSNISIKELIEFHSRQNADVTMALTDGPANKVLVSGDSSIIDIGGKLRPADTARFRKYTYTGIAAFNRKIYDHLPKEPCFSSIIDAILAIISENRNAVKAYIPEGTYWNDIGTFSQYFKAHEDILISKKFTLGNAPPIRNSYVKGRNSPIPGTTKLEGFATIGDNCRIGKNAKIKNCILLDGAKIGDFDFRSYELIAKNFSVHRDVEILKNLGVFRNRNLRDFKIGTLAEQGSNRRFYRLTDGRKHSVLMVSSSEDLDFERFLNIGFFLHKTGLGSPEIFEHSTDDFTVLMEDLGNDTLFRLMNEKKTSDIVSEKKNLFNSEKNFDRKTYYYRKVLDWLVEFQAETALKGIACQKAVNRCFDFEGLRWETSYFSENFLNKYLGISADITKELNDEFDQLAHDAMNHPQVLVHRDFQSQNIVIKNDRVRIVDFQGARLGPIAYDLMSLLRDPYVNLSNAAIEKLIHYYYRRLKDSGLPEIMKVAEKDFARFAVVAGLQRNMQALGAYAFLSLVKGKRKFLAHIPRGLIHLKEGLKQFDSLDSCSFRLDKLKNLISKI